MERRDRREPARVRALGDDANRRGRRVAESILPETDDDAVRIMTIHAAKGLEFPITIVSGMSTRPSEPGAPAEAVFPPTGGVGYRFGKYVTTEEWASWAPIDELMNFHERIRLLYVACTRACDHLIVSLHRRERAGEPELAKRTNAELLVYGMGDTLDALPDAVEDEGAVVPIAVPDRPGAIPSLDEWRAERDAALARGIAGHSSRGDRAHGRGGP